MGSSTIVHFLPVAGGGVRKTTPQMLEDLPPDTAGLVANVWVFNTNRDENILERRLLQVELVTLARWRELQSQVTHQHYEAGCLECERSGYQLSY